MKKKLGIKNGGQMLIEIVVAIGIIGLVLVGVSDLMTKSVRTTSFQKQKAEALTIIKERLGDYKTARDTNPESFYSSAENALIDPCVIDKPFRCLITMEKYPDSVKVSIKAEWLDGGKTYEVSLSQLLFREKK
jgi:type II secretory pathway pseudopilin PulG